MEINFFLFAAASYLVGSIPFAFVLTKISGNGDIRKIGSGNIGATNVLRTGKKKLAIIVLLLDIFKGFLPVAILSAFYQNEFSNLQIIIIGSLSIIGHIYPIWLKFKGGKGVASLIGFVLGVDYKLVILFIFVWILVALIKRYSSLASIVSIIFLPILAISLSFDIKTVLILTLLCFLIIFKHFSNIKRLISGSENKIKF